MSAHLSSYPNKLCSSPRAITRRLASINMTHVPHWRRQRWEKHTCRPTQVPACQPRRMCERRDTHTHRDNECVLSGTLSTQPNSPGSDTSRRKSFNGGNGGQKGDYCIRKGKKKKAQQWAATLSCGVLVKQQAGAFQDGCQKQLRSSKRTEQKVAPWSKEAWFFFFFFPTARKKNRQKKNKLYFAKTPDVITMWKID